MQTASIDAEARPLEPAKADAPHPDEHVIHAAVSTEEQRTRTLKHGDTFAVFDHSGDAISRPDSPAGIFHCDTRHLSHLCLLMSGARPMLLSSTLRDDNAALICDLANPDLQGPDGRVVLEHDLIHIRRSRFLWMAACFERLAIRNFDTAPHKVSFTLVFAADFADLFEVRGAKRERHGQHHPAEVGPDGVTLAYTGLDGRRRETELRFDPKPSDLAAGKATFAFDLGPGETQVLFIEIRCDGKEEPIRSPRDAFLVGLRNARRALRVSTSRAASIATSNEVFNEAARRSVCDLYMLITDTPEGPYPYAGVPWFSTVFGRDALITALQMLWLDPAIARGVLCHLAANQATTVDPDADAEPGKILHELRQGEMAECGEVPFRRYYGSIDSTPLFVLLAGAYLERTGDLHTLRGLWPSLERALDWIDAYGDRDGDGFVEYGRRSADGLVNQGWKDSHDSIFHADGRLADGPIALVEVQAYVFGAWRAAAAIAKRLGIAAGRAADLDAKAEALRRRFDECFFDAELGTYVLALDGDKRPCRVRASNAGHALLTGIAYEERAAPVVDTLMTRASFSGWGIRTVAMTEARYNPMSYHNGSIWPHDNALIAAGFARYGFRREAAKVFEGLFAASIYIDLHRLPELFCGFVRQRGRGPTFYPVACSPQAWAAAAPLSLIQSCLGLGFNPDAREITFEQPALPSFLDEVVLRRLTLDGASIDVALQRAGADAALHVLARTGEARVVTTS